MKLSEKLFGLLILLLPIQLGKHFWPDFSLVYGLRIDYLSPTIYLTDILIFLILFFWVFTEKPKIKISFWVIVGLFCLLLGIILSGNLGSGFYKLIKLLEFTSLGYYVFSVKSSVSRLLRFLPWALIFTSIIAIFQFCRQSSLNGWFWFLGERPLSPVMPGIALENIGGNLFLRSYATFSHPNSLAGFLLVGLILTLPLLRKSRFLFVYLGITLGALFLTFSFSSWFVGTLVLVIYFTLLLKKKFLILISGFFLLLLMLVSSFQFSGQSVWERWQLILSSVSMIKDNFWLGVGLNNFLVVLPEHWLPVSYRLWQPVHNFYLLVLSETGIFVFVIFMVFVFLTVKRLWIAGNQVLFFAFLAILFLGLFDHYWFTLQQNQILLGLVLGLSWQKNLPKEVQ